MKRFFSLILALILIFFAVSVSAEQLAISSECYIVTDANTGHVLLEKNSEVSVALEEQLVIFALLTAIKDNDLEQTIVVPDGLPLPNNSLQLTPGQAFRLKELLEMTALDSSVHSLYTIAYGLFNSPETFVEKIQTEMDSLGCKDTIIQTLDMSDDSNVTTLKDLAIAGKSYMEIPLFSDLSRTVYKEYNSIDDDKSFRVYNTNSLVSNYRHSSFLYSNAHGIKEAYSHDGNVNLLSTLTQKGNKKLIISLGCKTQDSAENVVYKDLKTISEYVFSNYTSTSLVNEDEPISEYPITNAAKGTHIILKASDSISALLPADLDDNDLEKKVTYHENIKAPIIKGDILGSVAFYFQGNIVGESNLYSDRDVSFQPTVTAAGSIFRLVSHPFTIICILVLALCFVLLFVKQIQLANKKSKRRKK